MKFSFSWLKSNERKELEQLRKEKIQRETLEDKKESWTNKITAAAPSTFDRKTYAYRSVRLLGDLVLVVLNDGSTLSKPDGGGIFFQKVRECTSEEQILLLFTKDNIYNTSKIDLEEKNLIDMNLRIIYESGDFIVVDGYVYMKELSMPLPTVIVAAFIEILEKIERGMADELVALYEEYTALRMFTLKLALNPIESSREDCLSFIRKNDIRITATGNLVAYRGIVSTGEEDKALAKFVSTEYFKVKKWKKSPANFFIWAEDDGSYTIHKGAKAARQSDGIGYEVGNLADLYSNLGEMTGNTYTDHWTRKMKIKIGEVYSIPEEEVDIDSRASCSNGLHVGGRNFMIGSFGDTKVLVLVNPAKVRSVPYEDAQKMRVSEMFIVCALEQDSEGNYMDADVDLVTIDEDYHNHTVEELQEALSGKEFIKAISCQDEIAEVTKVDMQNVINMLKSRINTVK